MKPLPWLAAAIPLALLARGATAVPRPGGPAQLPLAMAQPWMADALPDVGPKRREAVARSLANGRLDDLPPQARPVAREVFQCASP